MNGSSVGDTASVRVLLFSALREATGVSELRLALPEPPTGSALLDVLERSHPVLVPYRQVVRLAVNERYVPSGTRLNAGDEVALITPVSGG